MLTRFASPRSRRSLTSVCRSLFASSARRTVRRSRLAAEVCEARILPTPLGTVPTLTVTYQDHELVTGLVRDDIDSNDNEAINTIHIEVDLFNDGTVDEVIVADYDSPLESWIWEYQLIGMSGTFAEYEVALTPIEISDDAQHRGNTVVVTIPEIQNDAPVLVDAMANNVLVWGSITDSHLNNGGSYAVEVAIGDPQNQFDVWGYVEPEGDFYAPSQAPQNSGMVILFVRVREISAHDQALSNVIRLEYDSGSESPSEPTGEGSGGSTAGSSGPAVADADGSGSGATPEHTGRPTDAPSADWSGFGLDSDDDMVALFGSPDPLMAAWL